MEKIIKKLVPRVKEHITMKKDTEDKVVTDPNKLKEVYLETYVN